MHIGMMMGASMARRSASGSPVGGGGDPEAGLTLTRMFDAGAIIPDDSVNTTVSCVFACDLTIPASPVGVIHEKGASGIGSYAGFRPNHAFVLRGGDGGANEPTASTADAAVLYLPSPGISGAGTLVCEFDVATGGVRAWWTPSSGDLVYLGAAVATGGAFEANAWGGSADGGYGAVYTNQPNGESTTSTTSWLTSSLRYYENQISPL